MIIASTNLYIFFINITARSERYNHDIETAEDTEDEPEDSLFHSFNSCSPRYSKVYSKIEELHEVMIND